MADNKSREGERTVNIAIPKPPRTGPNVKQNSNIADIKVRMDFSESITGLKAIQREARKATAALKELKEQKKDKYLVIELGELGDVPKVFYKGEEVTKKEFINFQWMTKTDKPGRTDIIVDYLETDEVGYPVSKSIRESRLS